MTAEYYNDLDTIAISSAGEYDGSDRGYTVLPYNDDPSEGWFISGIGGVTESITEEDLLKFRSFVK